MKISDLVPANLLRPEAWNKQWLHDFREWYGALYFYHYQEIQPVAALDGMEARDVYGVQACSSMLPLWIWADGDDIVGKKLLEIGCGPGLLGKQLSFFCKDYVGMDQSTLAIDIARGVSPSHCHYYHATDDGLLDHAGSVDTLVSRFFFIHQNFENALWVLRLARLLLKTSGVAWADFFDGPGGIDCRQSSQDKHPTSGYNFPDADLADLLAQAGFRLHSEARKPNLQRRFARLMAI
jgi:SAM-dependent methyltransferase